MGCPQGMSRHSPFLMLHSTFIRHGMGAQKAPATVCENRDGGMLAG